MRLLLFSILFILVYLATRNYLSGVSRSPKKQDQKKKKSSEHAMVRCAYCHVFLPEQEAIKANGRYFCSKAHQDSIIN
ncbi:PP0621 family protein [Candidatus Nitrosacidococcus sp. I8]|uniref:PP0621 family protein n=1 Tax=Candidatus Nitrosacidococcus sp. I8 TaxID=2942908 RepID=UPI0022271B61|nr:PP0621 family protein [Candidatus Nitrosacidococcus sp. I8]